MAPHANGNAAALPLDRLLETDVRVLWVAAHPDDESFAGAILAKASLRQGNPLHMVVLTRGEGGEDARAGTEAPEGLGYVREAEMQQVARLYGATLQIERFWNAPLPVESFPPRHEIAARWAAHRDPTTWIAEAIRTFRPEILLTLAPRYGGTGHPEHQLAARFATAAVRLAAGEDAALPGEPHRVENVYFVLNHYRWIRALRPLLRMTLDPFPATETFDARQPCVGKRSCAQVMADNTRPHLTQNNDMRMMRWAARLIRTCYLHRTDPLEEALDPFEPATRGGMG